MLNYDLSRMMHRATFGTTKTVEDDTLEGSHEEFVAQFTLWAGEYTNTQLQTYTLLGTQQSIDLVIVIRHNPKVNKELLVHYQGNEYKIAAVDSDERIGAFDRVTLQLKGGYKDNN